MKKISLRKGLVLLTTALLVSAFFVAPTAHAVATLILTIPPTATITRSTLVPETSGVPTAGNAAVDTAVASLTPIAVTLQNTGDVASDNVRISPIGAGSNIQFWAKDSLGNWNDINITGWGPVGGFPVPATSVPIPTNVYIISDLAGTYPLTANLVLASGSSPITSASGIVTVNEPAPVTVANVANLTELNASLADTTITTINITADIPAIPATLVVPVGHPVTINGGSHTLTFVGLESVIGGVDDGFMIQAPTTINNLIVDAGLVTPTTFVGTYAIQVFHTTATLNNVTVKNGNGGILNNNSTTALTGAINVSGNGFGGIESTGVSASLDVSGATFTNTSEAFGFPTIWEDGVSGTTVINYLGTFTRITKGTQFQYYLIAGNSIDPAVTLATAKDITSFSFPQGTGVITGTIIAVTVPNGTDVHALMASFTTTGALVSIGATTQTSGITVNDFTSPVTYIVHATDASTQDYVVTVTIAPAPSDTTAPAAPIVDTVPAFVNTSPITVTGTAEMNSTVTIAGGSATATGVADATTGVFSIPVLLNLNASNTLSVTATDAAANVSTATVVTTTHDNVAPTATVAFDVTGPTNGSVIATITPSETVVGALTHTFLANGDFTFTFTDLAGNSGSVLATVANIDTIAPIITLNGGTPDITVGGSYTELGATALDVVDGSFPATPSGSVNTSLVGSYTITYNATDVAGNNAAPVTRTVNVIQAPSVTTVTCPVSETYTGLAQTPCSVSVTDAGGAILSPDPVYANNTNVGTASASYSFAGDANHSASSDSKTFAITKADQTIIFDPLSAAIKTFGDNGFSVSGIATSGLPVSFSSVTTGVCTVSGSTVSIVAAGLCTLHALQIGNVNYNAAPDIYIQGFTAQKATSSTVISCPASEVYTGSAQTPCTATVTGAGGFSQSVSVVHTNNTNVGTATGTATFAGDSNHLSSSDSKNFNITVGSSVASVNVTTSTNPDGTKSGTILGDTPPLDVTTSAGNVSVDMPADLTITGPSGWDGTLNLPIVVTTTVAPTPDSGDTVNVVGSIEVGSGDTHLTFNKAVKLTFTGQAGNLIGWSQGGVFHAITNACAADNQETGDALAPDTECKIDSAGNLVVWTKHFSTFTTYTQTVTPPSNNGGGGTSGGGFFTPTPAGQVLGASTGPIDGCDNRTTGFSKVTGQSCFGNTGNGQVQNTGNEGQVLGAASFHFTLNLKNGSKGNEVMEFQKFLNATGYDVGTADGKFGPKTKAAVIKFQLANGLKGDGAVGPITRAMLNK